MYKEYDVEFLQKVIEYNHNKYVYFMNYENFPLNPVYERVLSARYMKVSRIKRRFIYLLSRFKYIWFCTFTFDNYYINKCTRTKRDLIKYCINSHDFNYILNVDYGKQTEREHYHCIIGTNIDLDVNSYLKDNYPCFSSGILCKRGFNDFKKLSKYINKLTNHCIKATTKRQRILYNFKGYDNFTHLSNKEKTIFYLLDKNFLFNK